jgi:hypothetical protein
MKANKRLRQFLTSASLVTQALGFSLMGSFIALKGAPDIGSRIGGILAIFTGTLYFTATLAYWKHCLHHSRTQFQVKTADCVLSKPFPLYVNGNF